MNENQRGLLGFGIILGVSLIIVALIVGHIIDYVKTYNNSVITVTGVATEKLKSNDVKWRSTITQSTGSSTTDLKSASTMIQADLNQVLAYFQKNGVTSSELSISPLVVEPVYQTRTGVVTGKVYGGIAATLSGYTLSQTLLVESNNVEGVTKLAQGASQYLVEQGIVFTSQNPEYYISNSTLNSIRDKMLAMALSDAKDRAEAITHGVGASVGNLRSSSIGVTQITPVNSTEISNYGYYDTTSKEKLITYVVHATFTMK